MTTTLKDWWYKRTWFSFIEKDDALYLRQRNSLPDKAAAGVFILCLIGYAEGTGHRWLLMVLTLCLTVFMLMLVYRYYGADPFGQPVLQRPIVQVSVDMMTFGLVGKLWPLCFQVPLPTLRDVSVKSLSLLGLSICAIRCGLMDGQVKTTRVFYERSIKAAVIDFLRRKLPAHVRLRNF
jgi:hypothetical protein